MLAQAPVQPDTLITVLLGGGFLTGLAVLVRALATRGKTTTESIERTVLLQERIIKRQQKDLEEEEKDHRKTRDDLGAVLGELADARAVIRAYQRRHGEITDPQVRKLQDRLAHEAPEGET